MNDVPWMSIFCGPGCARQLNGTGEFEILMAGRDSRNRSQVGSFRIDLTKGIEPYAISPEPVLSFGELGAFDENGVSYPWLVEYGGDQFLFYNGWMPTVLTPFQIHLGLARRTGDRFTRMSRAPVLERTNDDFLSTGSACVLIENDTWRMWYTSFLKWGTATGEHKHYYTIKYAESKDGMSWQRPGTICIPFADASEFAICRPSVLKIGNRYHMWYSYRGAQYRIGYATSKDGIAWERMDRHVGIGVSDKGWDSQAVCYSYVFGYGHHLYMLYNGNEYGREGLGIARLKLQV